MDFMRAIQKHVVNLMLIQSTFLWAGTLHCVFVTRSLFFKDLMLIPLLM
jgi:hypothetical protein